MFNLTLFKKKQMKKTWYLEQFENEDIHFFFVGRRAIIKKVLSSFYSPNNRDRIRVVEIGCGTGGNLSMLSAFGYLYAVESNNEAISLASGRNICDIQFGSLPNNLPLQEKYDLICLLDVLEYVDDDLGSLRTLGHLLAPSGKILLTVPAYKFLWSSHDIGVENKRRYEKKELLELVSKADLHPVYLTYFNTILFPMIAIIRIIDKAMNKHNDTNKTDVVLPLRPVNFLLKHLFSLEQFIIPRYTLPYGLSLLLLLEKKE